MKRELRINDLVRVKRANGTFSETCYVVTHLDNFNCMIAEYLGDNRMCRPQPFDVSLIERVDRVPSKKIK